VTDFIQYLVARHEGEVYGEAVFHAMAEHTADPEARHRWRVLEALERETKELLARELAARGRSADPCQQKWGEGLVLGRQLAGVPRDFLWKGLRGEVVKFVAAYEAAEAHAPAEGAALARYVTAHERAILEMIDLELADPAADSTGPVAKLLANPPSRA
jgi:hypothetical protein